MRLTGLRLFRSLVLGVLLALALGLPLPASPASSGRAARCASALLAVEGSGAASEAGERTRADERSLNPNRDKEDWVRRIEQVEKRQRLTVIVIVAVVLTVLAIWWSWGKILHRRPRL